MRTDIAHLASGGSILKALGSMVAKEAPGLERGAAASARRATLNVGLDINGGEKLAPEDVLSALQGYGVKPISAKIAQSDSEPTLVVELDRALSNDEASDLSSRLRQEAIAQVDENGVGDLHGPEADKWKPFNGDYFIKPDGARLGNASAASGDPVLDHLRELSASLGEPVKKAGGGLIRDAAEMLMGAAKTAEQKALRLYHGRSFREPIKQLDPMISPNQLGIHLGDAETAGMFATIRDGVRPKDAGARVIPLDVDLKNPLRLQDTNGDWAPSKVYRQLVDQGLIPHDMETESRLHWGGKGYSINEEGTLIDDENAQLDAMLEIQNTIRGLGHDGVVYTNRYEFPDAAAQDRAEMRPRDQLNSMSDEEFKKEFPEARDSYIAFRKHQLKSPFGDGPGVGYADGGAVQKFADAGLVRKLGQGFVDLLDFSGVAGKPSHAVIPGEGRVAAAPIHEIDQAAESYMRQNGIPGTHRIDAYPQFDEDFAKRVADNYHSAQHAPHDPEVQRSYDALLEETMAQYHALKDSGLDVKFLKDGMPDPYAASPSMGYADMVKNGRLWVFPTSQGYGSGAEVLEHPLLKKVGKVGDLGDAVANDAFRVVHDAYGHFGPGNPFFRRQGEDRAWQHHARMFSDDALPAMSAETRGQNSWVNSGPHAEQNRSLSGGDTIYADQKATIMPPWVWQRDLGRKGFADGGPVSPEDAASMTHDHSYGVGVRPSKLNAMGNEFDLGEGPVYTHEDGSQYAPLDNVQGIYDTVYENKTLPFYMTPAAPVAAGVDTLEAIHNGDPLGIAMSVAGGIPGRAYKAGAKILYDAAKAHPGAIASALGAGALTAGSDDAEAGVFGRGAKWAMGGEGKDALNMALKMSGKGADNAEIMSKTGWFKDIDGHWKFWRPSTGGGFDATAKGSRLADVYRDPFLFDEYPHMKDIGYRRMNDEGAHWDAPNDEIVLGDTSKPGYNTPDAGGKYGAMTHEIYHAKSSAEGWPNGISVSGAGQKMMNDMSKMYGLKDPSVKALADQLFQSSGGTGMAHMRYEAEMGEALARREARMREFRDDNLRGTTPNDKGLLDIPESTLFHPGDNMDTEKYRALLAYRDQEIANMQKAVASGQVYFGKGKFGPLPKPAKGGR